MYKNILIHVDIDTQGLWHGALDKAVEMARACDAQLHVMTCVPDFGMSIVEQFFPADFDDSKMAQGALTKLEQFIKDDIPIPARAIIGEGRVRDAILEVVEQTDIDLIVLPPTREKSNFYTLGATAAHVVRHATCSTLVVRS